MRVTNRMMAEEAVVLNAKNYARLAELQAQAASGKRVTRPSDDPAAAGRALNLKSTLAANETYLQNNASASEWLTAGEAALSSMTAILGRALRDARQGASDTLGAEERAGLAQHVDGLLTEALAQLNAKHRGAYLFAGFKTTSAPFVPSGAPVASVSYAGDSGLRVVETEPGQMVAVNATGGAFPSVVFTALISLRDALTANNTAAIAGGIDDAQAALEGVLDVVADFGARQQRLADTRARLEEVQLGLRDFLSRTEDANLAETIVRLKEQETVYEASLQTSARLSRPNLFDFLR